jgi:outer membrane biosynthesis protein TonB
MDEEKLAADKSVEFTLAKEEDEEEKEKEEEEEEEDAAAAAEPIQPPGPPHSVFSKRAKVTYVYIASLAAFVSPVSTSIYYPAMVVLASDLNTSYANITFTVTTYMV